MAQRLLTHEERFAVRATIGPPEQCWLWEGQVHPINGYAQFWPHGRAGGKVYAHCYAYERWVGPIPEGLELDHLCHTNDTTCPGGPACPHRRCVNPWHLEPVTHEVNIRRGARWTLRDDGAWLCSAGHPIDEVYAARRGRCRVCFNDYKREWRKTHRERPTPGARARANEKRRLTRTAADTEAGTAYAARRRLKLFVEAHPQLASEAAALGITKCSQRLRRGWTFDGHEWHYPVT